MTFKDGFELSLAYHEGVLNLYMFGEHEWKGVHVWGIYKKLMIVKVI